MVQFQLDSDVCSADLHHNPPRKHVGLHAHQRLHRLPEDGLCGCPRLRVPRVVVLAGHLLAWLGSRQSVAPASRIHVLPCLLTLMSPRLWSAPSCGCSTLGSTVAEVPLTRPSTVASLSRMLSCLFVLPY
jgi:hypothetical protein